MFNHIIIIAMENQNYGSVIGSSSAPFINSLAALGTTISNYHSYGQNINGCSAGCYEAFTAGQQSVSDGWCPRASSPCTTETNIADQLHTAGLTSAMFCEDGCPRGADHFPWIGYTSTWNSCVTGSFTCNGQTGPDGNQLYGSSSSSGNSAFVNYLNSANPANYIWFTPTDSHNMHDNSVSSGDSYLQTLLAGTGTAASPSSGSLLATNLFKTPGTLLYIWWDEYDPSPNVEYGSMIQVGHTSTGGYDEYDSLHTIDSNWALPYITSTVSSDSGMTNIFGTITPPALTATFTTSPTAPTSGQTVTFTAVATGGTAPYSYSWKLGSTSQNGNPVTHTFTNGTYSITLTATDSSSKSTTVSQTLKVLSTGQSSTVPTLIGWGGVSLDEAAVGGGVNTLPNPPASQVFSGEPATDMELVLIQMKAMGYNTVRVDFDPSCTSSQSMSTYSAANLQRAIQIAQHYGFWIIADYHGYSEMFNTSTATCWLSFWSGVTSQFKNSYSQLIWEPINEPCYDTSVCAGNPTTNNTCVGATACLTILSNEYQQWINQARAQGDTHWIVVQNICSYGCSLSNWASGFPTVTDPLGTLSQGGKIFISLHSYMDYASGSWTNATADSTAQQYYQAVVSGVSNTGWPALNTEGGTSPLCSGCAPDQILSGSAGYTTVTLHFIQALTKLYDNNTPQRINWVWWTAGSWTDTPNAGIYGSLQCNSIPIGWGCLLPTTPITAPTPTLSLATSAPQVSLVRNSSANLTLTLTSLAGFTGTATLTTTGPGSGITAQLAQTSVTLAPSSQRNIGLALFTPNSTAIGSYSISIKATSGTTTKSLTINLRVTILGDVNGDGVVNIEDLAMIAIHYQATPTSSNWNPSADLNHDGVVDLPDLAIAAAILSQTPH